MALGVLVRKESPQWRMNRLGLEVEINLEWDWLKKPASPKAKAADFREELSTESPAISGPEVAPPPTQNCTAFAPPESDKELSYGESKNQKPVFNGPPPAEKTSGDCISKKGTEERTGEETSPTLRNIVPADLRETGRLLELHRQAVEAKLISVSERERLLFFGAAEHARSLGKANPCGLFIHLVRAKLWHFLTADDEDRANARLKAHLFGKTRERELPRGFAKAGSSVPTSAVPLLSEDARLIQAIRSAALRAGFKGDPFYLLRRERPEWTRERWDAGVAELSRPSRDSRNGPGSIETSSMTMKPFGESCLQMLTLL